MDKNSKNTYKQDTPEYILFENAVSRLRLEAAYLADEVKARELARDAKAAAELYMAALERLTGKG
jgi:hypothetical protein